MSTLHRAPRSVTVSRKLRSNELRNKSSVHYPDLTHLNTCKNSQERQHFSVITDGFIALDTAGLTDVQLTIDSWTKLAPAWEFG